MRWTVRDVAYGAAPSLIPTGATGGRRGSRAFTMLEIMAVLIIFMILSGITIATFVQVHSRAIDDEPRKALEAVTTAQMIFWDTRGSFLDDPEEMDRLDDSYTYVAASAESSGDNEISVGTGEDGGNDVLHLAVRSDSGTCLLLRSHEPDSQTPDVRIALPEDDTRPCTATTAAAVGEHEGTSW